MNNIRLRWHFADVRGKHFDRSESVQRNQGIVCGRNDQAVQWEVARRTATARVRYW